MKKMILSMVLAFSTFPAFAAEWEFAFLFGNAISAPETITITPDGSGSNSDLLEPISFNSGFTTKGFKPPTYYSVRFSRFTDNWGWELEHIHHKLYFDNTDSVDGLDNFEVTDGYNLFMINRAYRQDNWTIRGGVGTVYSHPEIVFSNGETNFERGGGAIPKIWEDGYHWSGFTSQIGLARNFEITERHNFQLETKLTHSKTKVPVAGGSVVIPNTAIHFLFGYAFDWSTH
jgi:hypothetical protein